MKIIGTSFFVPETVVTNSMISDSPDWVESTIGIKERRTVVKETATDLAYEASIRAIKASGIETSQIQLVIVATATPDKVAPSTACLLAERLGLNRMAFDINAVCSGFLYGLVIADAMSKRYNNILLVGVDVFSQITDYTDRNCVFFGDGAGAVVLTSYHDDCSFWVFHASAKTTDHGFTCEQNSTFKMNGKKVFENALDLVPKAINIVMGYSGIKLSDIDYMIPHQPSRKILEAIADKIGFPREKVLMNMDRYANTSAATIPILLAENWSKFKKGDKLLFASIGSGWTYGAAIYEV